MVDKLVARGLVPHVVVAVAEADTAHVLDHDIAHCCPWPGGEVAGFWRGRRNVRFSGNNCVIDPGLSVRDAGEVRNDVRVGDLLHGSCTQNVVARSAQERVLVWLESRNTEFRCSVVGAGLSHDVRNLLSPVLIEHHAGDGPTL